VTYNIAMAKKSSKSTKRKTQVNSSTKKSSSKKKTVKPASKQPTVVEKPAAIIYAKLPSIYLIAKKSFELIWNNRKLFIAICITYGLLNLILVQGLASGTNIDSLKSEISKGFTGHPGQLVSSVGVFAELLTSAGNSSSQTAGAYQLFLFVIISLAIIWTLRQIVSGVTVKMRHAFYQGMTPLIPFILVLLMFGIQLLPLLIGSALYGIIIASSIAVTLLEKIIFLILFLLFIAWSLYLVTSTVFALYIVTLPDMTPLKALRSAKQLVKKRRLVIIRKIIGMPVILLVVSAIIMVPIIFLVTSLAQWVFFILTTITLLLSHTYMYTLYRELLNE
jgi:hypothetical protein